MGLMCYFFSYNSSLVIANNFLSRLKRWCYLAKCNAFMFVHQNKHQQPQKNNL